MEKRQEIIESLLKEVKKLEHEYKGINDPDFSKEVLLLSQNIGERTALIKAIRIIQNILDN